MAGYIGSASHNEDGSYDWIKAGDHNEFYRISTEEKSPRDADHKFAKDYQRLSNVWRTTGDIKDNWESLKKIGFSQDKWAPHGGPGHWNDPDMMVLGLVGIDEKIHPTRLTPDEQYTHVSLWCLLSAPLLLGCDLAHLDDFTYSLLTNDEVLAIDQDDLGKSATRVTQNYEVNYLSFTAKDNAATRPVTMPFPAFISQGQRGR